jgi:proline dehydrogenase
VAKGYMQEIRERILSAEEGSVFSTSDFADIADTNTVRSALYRLIQDGILRRILNGVYEKPKYSKLLDEYVAADPEAVANALARSYHWTIAPCGNTALNLLGLSTQVTAVWSYISDGPYKTYEWNSTKLEFKHRTNKEITGLSYMTSLVIQALKTLGRSNVTPEVIQMLSEKLTDKDKQACLKEATESTDWVYDTIRQICGGEKVQ